jgi:DNA-binding MarR family transcriptional regulator
VSTRRTRAQVTDELRVAIREYLVAVDTFDAAVAEEMGVSRSDMRCLDLLDLRGTMTAGALAEASGLTTGAVTFLLDRLERAGMVRRRRDEQDRRRVLVEIEPEAAARAFELHRPLITGLRRMTAGMSVESLGVIVDYLHRSSLIYRDTGLPGPSRAGPADR